MAITQVYVDPAIAGDSGTGTIGDPYGDLQYALDTQARDATNGDQFNVKAGTAEVLAGTLSLATYGTPTAAAPLIFRGYTATAADGGRGEIDGGAAFAVLSSAAQGVHFVDMKLGNCGGADIVASTSGGYSHLYRCELHHTTGYAANGYILYDCYVHDATGAYGISAGGVLGCYIRVAATTAIIRTSGSVRDSVICLDGADTSVDAVHLIGHGCTVEGNVIVSGNANTRSGIYGQYGYAWIANNIVCGWSGAGGVGIRCDTVSNLSANAYYNCTTNATLPAGKFTIALAAAVALAADPFVDAANGDFSLTTAAKAALRGVGWPGTYLGAHANTDGHITIGPIQYGEAEAGGGGGRRPWLRMHGG